MNTFSGVNLAWPSTPAGETSVLSCPNIDGNATRKCSVDGVWEPACVCDCLTCFPRLFCYVCENTQMTFYLYVVVQVISVSFPNV